MGHSRLTFFGGVHKRFKTLPAQGHCPLQKTLGAHGTQPPHRLGGVHKRDVPYSARREPHYSSRRGPRWRTNVTLCIQRTMRLMTRRRPIATG